MCDVWYATILVLILVVWCGMVVVMEVLTHLSLAWANFDFFSFVSSNSISWLNEQEKRKKRGTGRDRESL